MKTIWLLMLLILLLQGCSSVAQRTRPAPVSEAGDKPPGIEQAAKPIPPVSPAPAATAPVERTEEIEVYAYRTEAPAFRPSEPVLALVERADALRVAGDLSGAAATLERALRIEPRNAHLWNRLARVRLDQNRFAQAESLAAKSNVLAGDAPTLKRDNKSIIAMARKAAGTGR